MKAEVLLPMLLFIRHTTGQLISKLFNGSSDLCEGPCASCWLSGDQVSGPFQSCCSLQHDAAEAAGDRRLGSLWLRGVGEKDRFLLGGPTGDTYGPVVNDPACGRPAIAQRRVVGGGAAGFGRFPWQALVRIGKSRCGGSLINRQHVVTAGHCVNNADPATVRVFLGEYSLYGDTEPLPNQEFGVQLVEKHPNYRFSPQADRYDVAVLRLDRPVSYEPHILPICLPEKDEEVTEGTEAIVSGWGAMQPDSKERPVDLQAVDVKVVSSRRCEKWHEGNNIKVQIFEDMMCAGHEHGGKDACQGDSGGPLMTQSVPPALQGLSEDKNDTWTLVGVVSAGFSCAKPGQPGIYHRVAKTSDWISHIANAKPDKVYF